MTTTLPANTRATYADTRTDTRADRLLPEPTGDRILTLYCEDGTTITQDACTVVVETPRENAEHFSAGEQVRIYHSGNTYRASRYVQAFASQHGGWTGYTLTLRETEGSTAETATEEGQAN